MKRKTRFLLIPILSLFVITLAFSLAPVQRGQAQQFSTVTPVPTSLPPIPTATVTPEFCAEPLDFVEGDIIRVNPGVIIRSEPSASSALLANFQDPVAMRVLGGPVCFGGFNWWNVTGSDIEVIIPQGEGEFGIEPTIVDVTGWVSEGRGDLYWISFVEAGPNRQPDCNGTLNLVEGNDFPVLNNVRLRAGPGLQYLTITVVPYETSVTVLEGPQCADGYQWYRVQAEVVGVLYEGWMAEGSRFGQPYVDVPPDGDGTICRNPQPLNIGDRAKVFYNDSEPKHLRSAPNLDAPILYDLVRNVPLEIIGGPVCAGTYNWWQVRVLASTPVDGWIAEGGPANYWIAPNRPTIRTAPTHVPTEQTNGQ